MSKNHTWRRDDFVMDADNSDHPTMAPIFSVALCTHNGARFIDEQVASILGQTLPPDEIIVSDDASTDDTVRRIRTAVDKSVSDGGHIRLRVLSNDEPLGVVRNFEQALMACRGDLIVLTDQDDTWDSNRLQEVYTIFHRRPGLLLLHGDAHLVDAKGIRSGQTLSVAQGVSGRERARYAAGDGFGVLLRRNIVTGMTVVIRRSLVELAVPIPAGWVHDEWLGIVAAAQGGIDFLDESLVEYRQHGENLIGVHKRGAGEKVSILLSQGSERNQRMLTRATVLLERLNLLGSQVPSRNRSLAAAKLAHERARARMPTNRLMRTIPVLREAATGRYSRFARGYKDIALDLVQPW